MSHGNILLNEPEPGLSGASEMGWQYCMSLFLIKGTSGRRDMFTSHFIFKVVDCGTLKEQRKENVSL